MRERFLGPSKFEATADSVGEVRESYRTALNRYQKLVAEVEVVQSCYIGRKKGFITGFIWNFLTGDFTPAQIQQDQRFTQLSEGARATIVGCKDYRPLRIANVIPSKVIELRRRYEQGGLVLTNHPVRDSFEQSTNDSHGSLDVLIGGLEPCDTTLQQAHEIAIKEITGSVLNPRKFEEIFRLTIFDRVKDKKAGVMLKDITIARVAVEEGFVSQLELLAEPTSVLRDLLEDPFDLPSSRSITELDVRGAIEAGALACIFNTQADRNAYVRKYNPHSK